MELNNTKILDSAVESEKNITEAKENPTESNLSGNKIQTENFSKLKDAENNLGSMAAKQISWKRNLRERKPRGTREKDSAIKCHIWDKNGLRTTLIAWNQGSEEWNVYFWNIWIKKFGKSITEEDYINGIECPVCQGICSWNKWRTSVLEEDFQKVNELLAQSANKNGGMGNQNSGLNFNQLKPIEKQQIEVETAQNETQALPVSNKISNPIIDSSNVIDSTGNTVIQNSKRRRRVGQPRGPYNKNKTAQDSKKKLKRGRKKKNKNPHEGSSDSDWDLFNYDKFLKRVIK